MSPASTSSRELAVTVARSSYDLCLAVPTAFRTTKWKTRGLSQNCCYRGLHTNNVKKKSKQTKKRTSLIIGLVAAHQILKKKKKKKEKKKERNPKTVPVRRKKVDSVLLF